ncbi:hypothetical protein EYC80_004991 [Monilinia laxa]|uniref:Uncharacterized protein n=1 Tax=Monilinia laxa TaxID=61186 RepID=A0A5N6KIS0_MONLA|nr:hypothetical protein EYC80_004991 [Monilinia laxa]
MPFQHPPGMCLVVTFAEQIEKIKDKMLFDEFDVLTFIYFHRQHASTRRKSGSPYFYARQPIPCNSCFAITSLVSQFFSFHSRWLFLVIVAFHTEKQIHSPIMTIPPTNSTKNMLLVTLVRVSYADNGKFAESQPDRMYYSFRGIVGRKSVSGLQVS